MSPARMARLQMEPRLFSVEEAQRLVPQLQKTVAQLRDATQESRDAGARISVLVQQHTEAGIDREGNPDRAAYWALVAQGRQADERVQALLDEVHFLGAEVKDLDLGLVDLRSRRDGEVVYLCWRLGEPRIEYWHELNSGFAGRKPLGELEQRSP